MLLAYSVYYLIASFQTKLPWETCDPAWASPSKLVFQYIKERILLLI